MIGPIGRRRTEVIVQAGLVAVFALLLSVESASAAPVTFNTALPVAKGEFIFREQFLYRKAGDDPSPATVKWKSGAVSPFWALA